MSESIVAVFVQSQDHLHQQQLHHQHRQSTNHDNVPSSILLMVYWFFIFCVFKQSYSQQVLPLGIVLNFPWFYSLCVVIGQYGKHTLLKQAFKTNTRENTEIQ